MRYVNGAIYKRISVERGEKQKPFKLGKAFAEFNLLY